MAVRERTRFRAVRSAKDPALLDVQYSHDGSTWHGSVNGLDVDDVRTAFARMKASIIVDTQEYVHGQ